MADYSGYVDVPHASYTQWKANTIGNSYNLDGAYGAQCWDYASLFWRNVGFAAGYPLTGPNHYASECWTVNKTANAGAVFDLITSKEDIKRGDIIVMDGTLANPPGHITFADEDYNGTNYLNCLGQNQGGGTPAPGGGTVAVVTNLGLGDFLGAFRYKAWHPSPTPTPTTTQKRFPWVIYANKFRQKRSQP